MAIKTSESTNPTSFVQRLADGTAYLLGIDSSTYIAALAASGSKLSIDGGLTWGATRASPAVLGPIFALHSAIGGAPVGRLIARPIIGGSSPNLYYSDNSGATWVTVNSGSSKATIRGAKILQTRGALKYVYVKANEATGTPYRSGDGGATFSVAGSVTGRGAAFEVRNDGRVEGFGGSLTGFLYKVSIDEGVTVDHTNAAFVDGASWDQNSHQSGYHENDDVIGVVARRDTGAAQTIIFCTVDTSENVTLQWESADIGVVTIDWVSPIPSITGGWAISIRTATKSRIYWNVSPVTLEADLTSFSLLLEHDQLVAGEGVLSNLERVAS